MKGSNTLKVCKATMMSIVQEWADKHLVDKVKVTNVAEGRQVTDNCFDLSIEAVEENNG